MTPTWRAPTLHADKCIFCEHPVSALSAPAVVQAQQDHLTYRADLALWETDPHWEQQRMNALIVQ